MSHPGHSTDECCVCRKVMSTCRCPGPKVTRLVAPCAECAKKVPDEEYVLIVKRESLGDCALFWAENHRGYTGDISKAHVFTRFEAWNQHDSRPDVDIPVPLRVAKEAVVSRVRKDPLMKWFQDREVKGRTV